MFKGPDGNSPETQERLPSLEESRSLFSMSAAGETGNHGAALACRGEI